MVTPEQRKHWASEVWLLKAILTALISAIVGGGIWIGTIQTKVERLISDIQLSRQDSQEELLRLKNENESRLRQLESDVRPIARLEERLISQQTQLSRIERLLERVTGTNGRPPYGRFADPDN